jgi:hypothetical protein
MTTATQLLQKLRQLSPEQQQAVLELIERLTQQRCRRAPRKSARGRWSDLKINISPEDIRAVRQEMWAGFPREDAG